MCFIHVHPFEPPCSSVAQLVAVQTVQRPGGSGMLFCFNLCRWLETEKFSKQLNIKWIAIEVYRSKICTWREDPFSRSLLVPYAILMQTCQISVPICSIAGEIQHLLITDMKNSQFKTNWVTLRIAMWPDNSNDCQRPHFVTARAKWFQLRAVRQSKSMKCGRILQTCDYVYVYVYTHVGWTNLWLHKDVSATNLGIYAASVSTKVGLLTFDSMKSGLFKDQRGLKSMRCLDGLPRGFNHRSFFHFWFLIGAAIPKLTAYFRHKSL